MLKKMIGGCAAVMALSGLSGCCSFWEKHCAQPAYSQPVCCQPCAPACPSGCAPAGYTPQANWTAPAQHVPGCCQ
jgi:hypothetical protein